MCVPSPSCNAQVLHTWPAHPACSLLSSCRPRQNIKQYQSELLVWPRGLPAPCPLQAMASGLPVVAAAAGGVPSVIGKPGVAGLLFPPGDAEAAAGAVQRLVADPAARWVGGLMSNVLAGMHR